MKKFGLSLALCVGLTLFGTSFAYAADKITEAPNVKIVINGKTATYKETPILVKGRTLLPMTAVLQNLGVESDGKQIVWNGKEKSITINKDGIEIYLKVGSKTAYVNGKAVEIDAAPVVYKGKTYVPATFIAQSLGKRVAWEGTTKAVLIRDSAEFDDIKQILDKSDEAMSAVEKAKLDMDIDMSMQQKGIATPSMDLGIGMSAEVDNTKKAMYMNMEMAMLGQDIKMEAYFIDHTAYVKSSESVDEWIKQEMTEKEYEDIFTQNDTTTILNTNDVLCAGLIKQEGTNPDEIILKGDTYLSDLLNKATQSTGSDYEYELSKSYVEISINKNTNLLNRVYMDITGTMNISGEKVKFNMQISCKYSDLNGNFEIKVPQDVIDNAVETDF
ncbi:MAG: copper amine oxidase N-terminal domain-containing protein [Clostridia bacterium]|nr:copper amine oxidase N-terminal domain-containing protein [Clostridia bacterium]